MRKSYTIFGVFALMVFLVLGFVYSGKDGRHGNGVVDHTPAVQMSSSSLAAVVYVDSLNGANDTTSLKARGYKVYKNTTVTPVGPIFYQGDPISIGFDAYNGPDIGFLGTDYNSGGTGTGNIDNWLVLPRQNVLAGDTLAFYSGAYNSTAFPDSIRVMYSAAGDSVPTAGSWVELGRFFVKSYQPSLIVPWERRSFPAPTAGANGRFAIRYCIVNAGALGANGSTVGIDMITIERSTVGINPINNQVPSAYSLSQNYPNPFNPVTNIEFGLPKNGDVKLAIYNALGTEVGVVFNGYKTAGNYKADFNAVNLSSGVYFYKLIAADFTATKKMMLIK